MFADCECQIVRCLLRCPVRDQPHLLTSIFAVVATAVEVTTHTFSGGQRTRQFNLSDLECTCVLDPPLLDFVIVLPEQVLWLTSQICCSCVEHWIEQQPEVDSTGVSAVQSRWVDAWILLG